MKLTKTRMFWAWALTLPLMAFSAFRNIDLLQSTLPNSTLAIIMSIAGLFALDLGVLLWIKLLDKADSEDQSNVATIMIVIDMAGVIVGVLADTWLQTNNGADRSVIAFIANWAIPIIIGINFVAGVMYKLYDPGREVEMEQRRIAREIERERMIAALDLERAEAGAEIALQKARAAQIRQSQALNLMEQAQQAMATATTRRGNGNGHKMNMEEVIPATAPKGDGRRK